MELPVGSNQMVKHVASLLSALFASLCCCSPAVIRIDQRRPGERLPGEALKQDFPWTSRVRLHHTCIGGKHVEAQAHAIGRASRLFIHQAHIVQRSCKETLLDLQDEERQAEES